MGKAKPSDYVLTYDQEKPYTGLYVLIKCLSHYHRHMKISGIKIP